MTNHYEGDCEEKKEPCTVINVYCDDKKPKPPCPCPDECVIEFAQAYSIQSQTLAPSPGINMAGDPVLLENIKVATSNIDTSMAAITGELMIKKTGWYDIGGGICGFLNPLPVPLPVFTVSIFKNGALIPGVTFSNVPLSPAQGSNLLTAETFEYFVAGDKLKLANTSTSPLLLVAPPVGSNPGTNVQTSSAYLKLNLVSCDQSFENPEVTRANLSFFAALQQANILFVASSAVDISQNPADALTAQTEANNMVAIVANASVDLAAAAGFATPASFANASSNMANLTAFAAASLVAADNVVSSLTPVNTQLALIASGQALSGASILSAQPLIAS